MTARELYIMRGICPKCHKYKAAPGRVTCEKCLARQRDYGRRRSERLKAQGVCVMCGKAPARNGRTMCFACAVKVADSISARRARNRDTEVHGV